MEKNLLAEGADLGLAGGHESVWHGSSPRLGIATEKKAKHPREEEPEEHEGARDAAR